MGAFGHLGVAFDLLLSAHVASLRDFLLMVMGATQSSLLLPLQFFFFSHRLHHQFLRYSPSDHPHRRKVCLHGSHLEMCSPARSCQNTGEAVDWQEVAY